MSWGLVYKKTGKTVEYNLFAPPEEIRDGYLLTYWGHLPMQGYSECPKIRLVTKQAEGFARQTRMGRDNKPYWELKVFGSSRDEVLEVVRRLEDSIGVLDLKPPLTLPDGIETVVGRIMYIVSWITGR